ncbi:response regulator transcription factor [Nocardiopsis suaedae]|uniref:Response regulator transcription factor n=1 Tax=Nocardiopsis suaedae TaxID=3018444 RepID=A0ABT4TFY6_9ACTN|nr:response regulator transcription factor [Nocardiopsis suaedae]MDA2803550.1 response regulator transcription factor [Nocardiopsis suaedae]
MTLSSPLTVLIADDDLVLRAGLASTLQRGSGLTVVETASGAEAVKIAEETGPDAALVGARIPALATSGTIKDLTAVAPVVLLAFPGDGEAVREAVAQGAAASLVYGSFTPPELAEAVRAVARSGAGQDEVDAIIGVRGPAAAAALRADSGLTEREAQVLRLVAGGMSNAMIADHLVVSEKTVKNHINHIYAKLHVRNRTQAIERWRAAETVGV